VTQVHVQQTFSQQTRFARQKSLHVSTPPIAAQHNGATALIRPHIGPDTNRTVVAVLSTIATWRGRRMTTTA
jgi:hypothetical protein